MLQKEIDDLSIEDIRKIISESIKRGKGLISYRKHLLILKSIEMKLKMLSEYRKSLVKDVDDEISKLLEGSNSIRMKLKEAIESDESIPKTEAGGKSMTLPDVGTVSLSKEIERVVIEDAEKALKALGEGFERTITTLDKKKAAYYVMQEPNKKIPGIKMEKDRDLKIIFKK
mgnify:CR=1 FL=1